MYSWPSEADLVGRISRLIRTAEQPIAFLLGSGASLGSIPGTKDMIAFFRRLVQDDVVDVNDFDTAVAAEHQSAHQYQTAARMTIDRAGIRAVNRAVRLAVLSARSPRLSGDYAVRAITDEVQLKTLEEDWQHWAVPRGLTYLGRLLNEMSPELRGPILTTNFDGLIEISCRAAGLTPKSHALDTDGDLPSDLSSSAVNVVHLHGFWREKDTMHTMGQLQRERPQLRTSLRRLLTGHTVVVVGYGGWDDVFTHALRDLIMEGNSRQLDVVWASYGTQPAMGVLPLQSVGENLQAYVSVNLNTLTASVLERVTTGRTVQQLAGLKRVVTAPTGWECVDAPLIAAAAARQVTNATALAFFDGRQPQWHDVCSGLAPTLSITAELRKALSDDPSARTVLALAPAGEGKSTAMRQVAVQLAQEGSAWRVLWRSVTSTIDVEALAKLPPFHGTYALLVDDADLHYSSLKTLMTQLLSFAREDFVLLASARDTDWYRAAGSSYQPQIEGIPAHHLGGVSRSDAEELVRAWGRMGADGLGRLREYPTEKSREKALLAAATSDFADRSSLLGALLTVRHSEDLHEYVRLLMSRLQRAILPSGITLAETFLATCLSPKFDLPPVTLGMMAGYCECSVEELMVLVVRRLGREAAAELHGDWIRPRHDQLARTSLSLATEAGADVDAVLQRLVQAATRIVHSRRATPSEISWAFCSQQMTEETTALSTAASAANVPPQQMRLLVNQVQVLRRFGRLSEAAVLSDKVWRMRSSLQDASFTSRRLLQEWARARGQEGRWVDSAALVAIALIDHPDFKPLEARDAYRLLSGLALSLNNIDGNRIATAKAARFAVALALDLSPDAETAAQLRATEQALGEGDTGSFGELSAAITGAVRPSREGPAVPWKRGALPLTQLRRIAATLA